MKPSEIELTPGDVRSRDRIVKEICPMSVDEVLQAAGETMQAERARVVTLIDAEVAKCNKARSEAKPGGVMYQHCLTLGSGLLVLREQILAGHKE